jgi:uncharacterized protein YecE (DUF72 family)
MDVLVGTSGYGYKEWKGSFYPADMKPAGMLRFYAERFRTVEVNNTFYRMPAADLLARWGEEVPPAFTFVLKAPQRITHMQRLSPAAFETLGYFFETARSLGDRLGPALFQLPPNFKKDVPRLQAFLEKLPPDRPAAFEFRHESWTGDDVHDALRAKGVALCAAETDEQGDAGTPIVPTAGWGYLRLRRADYADDDLARWAERILAQPWERAFVFFKHEDAGKGPAFARRLLEKLSSGATSSD